MAGYIRQDTTNNIANGNIINANDLDNEYDAIAAAFGAITGHKHDGTDAEGAPITKVGPVQDVVVSSTAVTPKTDNTVDLGSSTSEFKDLYIDGVANIDSLVADTADINGGTVDNTAVGATTPSTGAFTTLSASGAVSLSGGTANGVLYLNGSKAVSSGSALTFDGSNLGIGTSSPARKLDVNGAARIGGAAGAGFIGFSSTVAFDTSAIGCAVTTGFGDSLGLAVQNATGVMTFATNSTERMRIDSNGNLGLGVTPSAWGGPFTTGTMEFRNGSGLYAYNGATQFGISNNAYYDGTNWKYKVSGASGLKYEQTGSFGTHAWFVSPSGTAGNPISFTQAMTLHASGGLSVGSTTDPGAGNVSVGANKFFGLDTNAKYVPEDASVGGALYTGGGFRFFTGGATERMRLDSNGNLGLGVTPSAWGGGVKAIQTVGASLWSSNSGNSIFTQNGYNDGTNTKYVTSNYASQYQQATGGHYWYTAPSGTAGNPISFTQAMTLDASGNLLVGQTGDFNEDINAVRLEKAIGAVGAKHATGVASGSNYCFFTYGTSIIGAITQNGTSGVSYNTSSDYRLKHDIAPMQGALARVNALKPVTYKWNADNSDGEGFIAHELAAVCPQAVTGEKDAVDADGKPVYQGIDTSFLVATLTAAIQEQQKMIEEQRGVIDSLTTRIEALEAK